MLRASAAAAFVAALGVNAAPALDTRATDPCSIATGSYWVSSAQAHACELNVPFNQSQSLFVVNNVIKALQYYSLETWFLQSPNPQIPHSFDVRLCLNTVKTRVQAGAYATDWDFNTAVTDCTNQEMDGHTNFIASCAESFSYNLPFGVSTLAADVSDSDTAYPTLLVNYDFPNQGRPNLEAYYQGLGFNARKYDGFRILQINGQDASQYLINLAQNSSVYNGLFGSYEAVEPRYMRLMSRYSADTVSGDYTFEVGRWGMRAYYPGADSVTLTLQNNKGNPVTITVPWAAHFVGSGTDTPSYIANSCLAPTGSDGVSVDIAVKPSAGKYNPKTRVGIVDPDSQDAMREIAADFAKKNGSSNYVRPNLVSYGSKVVTIDIYKLKKHPKVGVVYMEQFEPENSLGYAAYFQGVSDALYTGLTALKNDGVEYLIIDQSGNRGGYINAGAIALWSLFPNDLYPGFPAQFRALDLAQREAKRAAKQQDANSEYYYGNYRDLSYQLLTSNKQFMNPVVNEIVNGVPDFYSQQFFDDFGPNSSYVTNFTSPPFPGTNIVFVGNSICASTCSVFTSYLYQKHGVRSAVFGGLPTETASNSQIDGGVKGSEVTSYSSILYELGLANLQNDNSAPQPLPIEASFNLNFRNAIPYIDQQDGILEYVWEGATTHYQFTKQNVANPQAIWEFVAGQYFSIGTAVVAADNSTSA